MTINTKEIQAQVREAEERIADIATQLKIDLYKKGISMGISIELDSCSRECWPKKPYKVIISAGVRIERA